MSPRVRPHLCRLFGRRWSAGALVALAAVAAGCGAGANSTSGAERGAEGVAPDTLSAVVSPDPCKSRKVAALFTAIDRINDRLDVGVSLVEYEDHLGRRIATTYGDVVREMKRLEDDANSNCFESTVEAEKAYNSHRRAATTWREAIDNGNGCGEGTACLSKIRREWSRATQQMERAHAIAQV